MNTVNVLVSYGAVPRKTQNAGVEHILFYFFLWDGEGDSGGKQML